MALYCFGFKQTRPDEGSQEKAILDVDGFMPSLAEAGEIFEILR